MLDVEYLLERPRLEGLTIYKYRTGVLRREVIAAIADQCARAGATIQHIPPERLVHESGGNLLTTSPEEYRWCDWRRKSKASYLNPQVVLSELASNKSSRFAFMAPVNSALLRYSAWTEAEAAAFLIEEPEITSQTLRPVLRYLESTSELVRQPNLTAQRLFIDSFAELLEEGGTLAELIQNFEFRVVTRTDPITGIFDARRYGFDDAARRGSTSPSALLRTMVLKRDVRHLVDLVAHLDLRQQRGWVGIDVIVDLHASTTRLLRRTAHPEEGRRPGKGRSALDHDRAQDHGALLWAVTFLAWEERLIGGARSLTTGERRSPSTLMPTVHQLGRDFLNRSARPSDHGQFVGLWADLHAALARVDGCERERLSAPRLRTVQSLAKRLARSDRQTRGAWRERLQRAVASTLERAGRESAERDALDDAENNNSSPNADQLEDEEAGDAEDLR